MEWREKKEKRRRKKVKGERVRLLLTSPGVAVAVAQSDLSPMAAWGLLVPLVLERFPGYDYLTCR